MIKRRAELLHAVLLAGGQSRRMGQDKAGLDTGNGTLLENRRLMLKSIGNSVCVWVSGRTGIEGGIPDRLVARGPMGGLYSVLCDLSETGKLLEGDIVFVAPVDMPRLDAEMVRSLVKKVALARAVHFFNFEMPFAFVYKSEILDVIGRMSQLSPADFSVQRFLSAIGAIAVEGADESKMVNVNWPQEWGRVKSEFTLIAK